MKKITFLILFLMISNVSHSSKLDNIQDSLDEMNTTLDYLMVQKMMKNINQDSINRNRSDYYESQSNKNLVLVLSKNDEKFFIDKSYTGPGVEKNIMIFRSVVEFKKPKISPNTRKYYYQTSTFYSVNCSTSTIGVGSINYFDNYSNDVDSVDYSPNLTYRKIIKNTPIDVYFRSVCKKNS